MSRTFPIIPLVFVNKLVCIVFLLAGKFICTLIVQFLERFIFPVYFVLPINFLITSCLIFYVMIQHSVSQRISYPINKLAILVIGYFGIVHVKTLNRNGFGSLYKSAADIFISDTDVQSSRGYINHSIGIDSFPCGTFKNAEKLTILATATGRNDR